MQDWLWLLGPGSLIILVAYLHIKERDGKWHRAGDGMMRRFRNGKFETRPLNQDEINAWQAEQW